MSDLTPTLFLSSISSTIIISITPLLWICGSLVRQQSHWLLAYRSAYPWITEGEVISVFPHVCVSCPVYASACGQTAAVWSMLMVMKAVGPWRRWRGGQVDHSEAHKHRVATQRMMNLHSTACTNTVSFINTPHTCNVHTFIAPPCWLRGQCKFS